MDTSTFPFDNTFAQLPERFYARLAPTPVSSPRLVRLNDALAQQLRLDPTHLTGAGGVEVFAGNCVPDRADPLAMAYAGFQFGSWVPQLGDGRAILLGELIDCDGQRRDVQLKGAGRTPFSRMGDGRAGLGPVLREYIVSEAMAALGIPTTRSLAAVLTGERVIRENSLPGAVLTRVASSHIRVGTFQYFAARRDTEALALLADYVIHRLYPSLTSVDEPYLALLSAVIDRQAALVAQWQLIGFIHGVMNTDNMSIAGETIDYGPCAFMDTYHPETVYSSIDHMGRYAYQNQPSIAHWNLAGLAQALLPLLSENEDEAVEKATAAINTFPECFKASYTAGLGRKLGLFTVDPGDEALGSDLLERMARNKADFTLTFRYLSALSQTQTDADEHVRALFEDPAELDQWVADWRERLKQDGIADNERQDQMRKANPIYIPRNHLVEAAIRAAEDSDDPAPFNHLVTLLASPYQQQPDGAAYAEPPRPEQVVHQTFCGT